MTKLNKKIRGIAKVLLLTRSENELARLIDDLLTPSEVNKVHERIRIIDCYQQGFSQRETKRKTKAAIATITRGAVLVKKPGFILNRFISKAKKQSWWRTLFWRT
jgi:Trp operon repressor